MSTQPERGSRNQPFILRKRSLGKCKAGRWEAARRRGRTDLGFGVFLVASRRPSMH